MNFPQMSLTWANALGLPKESKKLDGTMKLFDLVINNMSGSEAKMLIRRVWDNNTRPLFSVGENVSVARYAVEAILFCGSEKVVIALQYQREDLTGELSKIEKRLKGK